LIELMAFATSFRFNHQDFCHFRNKAILQCIAIENQEEAARRAWRKAEAQREVVEIQELLAKMKAEKQELNRRRVALLEAQRKRREEQEQAALALAKAQALAATQAIAIDGAVGDGSDEQQQAAQQDGALDVARSPPSTASTVSISTSMLASAVALGSSLGSSSDAIATSPSRSQSGLVPSTLQLTSTSSPAIESSSASNGANNDSNSNNAPTTDTSDTARTWEDQRLNHAFHFLLQAWRGCQWSGKIKFIVHDDPIPGMSHATKRKPRA
jgi:hypothetical protein